jgi:hypothetical protein
VPFTEKPHSVSCVGTVSCARSLILFLRYLARCSTTNPFSARPGDDPPCSRRVRGFSTEIPSRTSGVRFSNPPSRPHPGAHPNVLQTLRPSPEECLRRSSSLELLAASSDCGRSPGQLRPEWRRTPSETRAGTSSPNRTARRDPVQCARCAECNLAAEIFQPQRSHAC